MSESKKSFTPTPGRYRRQSIDKRSKTQRALSQSHGRKSAVWGFSVQEAKQIGEELGIDWSKFDVEQFRMGLDVELEHGTRDASTNVSSDDPIITGKIALAHLNEFADYYTRLAKMEKEADEFWGKTE